MRILTLAAASLLATGLASAANATNVIPRGGHFLLNFDENGNGSYRVWDVFTASYGPVVNDPGYSSGGYLTYNLPFRLLPADVTIDNPNGQVSEGLRFGEYTMQFFSLPGGGELADTGFPSDFNYSVVGATENAAGAFQYIVGDGNPSSTNFFNDLSSVPGPGPGVGIASLGVLAFAGFCARMRRA